MSLLDTASLIVTPNGYKEGKLYSVIPSDGSGDMSVVRATTATRVNSAGLVELVPYNLLKYSQEFENSSYWSYYQSTITANNTTAPDGTMTADRLNQSFGTGGNVVVSTANNNAGNVTLSAYLKKGNGAEGVVALNDGSWKNGFFNLTLGTVTYVDAGVTASITDAGNGWWRCSITINANTNSVVTNIGHILNTGEFGYLWGAQLVEGTLPKDYQKTETRLNIPRLDYSNGTCPSLLVEPQRTNLFTYSSSFDNSNWQKEDVSVTANASTSPSGNTDADKLVPNTNNNDHTIYQSASLSGAYTLSVYAKADGYNYVFVGANNNPTTAGVFFNLTNGTISFNTGGFTASIEDAGNGWYRCVVYNASWPTTEGMFCTSANGTSVVHAGNGTSGIYIWGAQLEAGSYPTSYIPTTSASVTRNADVVSKTGISSLIGQTEGTIFVDFYNYGNNTNTSNVPFSISNGAYGDAVYFEQYLGNWYGIIFTGFTQQFAFNAGTLSIGRHKFAIAYKTNDIAFYADGNQLSTDTSATIPACSRVDIGTVGTSTTPEQLAVNASALWKTRLTNTQLAQLTTI